MSNYSCFKAYDIRGRIPDQLNEEIAYRIGRAFAQYLGAKRICLGHDIRLTSPEFSQAVARGINDAGAEVLDIGMSGTEEMYFATFNNDVDGGVVVTASHNPIDYNGMKLVKRGSQPISGDTGLLDIKALAESGDFNSSDSAASITPLESRPAYLKHLLSYIDVDALAGLKIACNAGNGGAGLVIDALEPLLPIEFTKVFNQPDGNFPNGIPNPLLLENRQPTIDAVIEANADFGIAWDGDFDRCFFFDEKGQFIEGYYIVGLLAEAFLQKTPGQAVVHDPRLTWNTCDIVNQLGGKPIMSKTGHAFIKERMRLEDAVYGGEMSAHHYFRDFAYCDSGMIPWLLIAELVAKKGQPLSSLVSEMISNYPVSGEINRTVADADAVISSILDDYQASAIDVDYTDGVSVSFDNWRFNIRKSNTEPLLRLNVESRGDMALMQAKTEELLAKIQ
ncbi:MAG: phosphomannomutase [Cellvibrionales bacterium]|nr:phosphomannomutase [Cellvibrionales bacterium]